MHVYNDIKVSSTWCIFGRKRTVSNKSKKENIRCRQLRVNYALYIQDQLLSN